MSIIPLPVFEKDLAEYRKDRETYERLEAPKTIVVRFGRMALVGEFPYRGDQKPGCGSKIVVRTFRGIEVGEMLTSTCPNAGCSKSVTRKEMLDYIENSGGKDYPFYTDGKALRVATVDDMNEQRRLESRTTEMRRQAQAKADELGLAMKIVEAEPILGGERMTFYFIAEERIDFRDLVNVLAKEHSTRIDMRQVGARDEARLTADYERCGQHCCCKQFLKVLKPVSMRSAKMQKASLDPLKISGRCGRLMCCLRYEDQSYQELKKRLPHMKSRVGSPLGIGIVMDRQILTQLVKLKLEKDNSFVAVPVEELCTPEDIEQGRVPLVDPMRGATPEIDLPGLGEGKQEKAAGKHRRRSERERGESESDPSEGDKDRPAQKRRRRRGGRGRRPGDRPKGETGDRPAEPRREPGPSAQPSTPRSSAQPESEGSGEQGKKRRRRRRGGRRRRKDGEGGGAGGVGGAGGAGGSGEKPSGGGASD